jgi:hypothetical protein
MYQNSIRKPVLVVFFAVFTIIATVITSLFVYSHQNVAAAPIVDFKPGRIIEDGVFTNSVSMNPSQIQSFLNAKVPTCDTQGTQPSEFGGGTRAQYAANASLHPKTGAFYPPFTCLKDYSENGLSAAQIIYNVAQQYQINPQVFIVLLQKEQSLVTDTWPSPSQYKTATGYGCPDTAPCDSQYFGLTNQITWSAKMFRSIINNDPNWYTPYTLGNNFIRWSPTSSCGGSNVYIENRSTQALYNYTPYQPNAAALNAGYGNGDSCSAYGNRNFYLYFRDWFGYNSGPAAFKTANSPTVYVPVEGYKMAVSSMALLNDYGVSASSIQTVDQAYLDARPAPPLNTNFSSSISYVVKSPDDGDEDGGSVYLISKGQRYQFQTMQQFYNYGFTESDISYLPLSYIFSKPDAGPILNYATSPSQEVFLVDSTGKHLYFQYSTYIKQNPTDKVTALSYNLVDHIPSANPNTDNPVLVKYGDSSAVYVYQNNSYYLIPDYITYSQCWGFDRLLNMPIYTPSQNNYVKSISPASTLSCAVNDGTTTSLLNGDSKYTVPTGYGITSSVINTDLQALSNRLPTKARQLSSYVKTADNPSVWYINSGKKYLVPNYANFVALGLKDSDVDIINNNTVSSFTTSGIKLADGTLVKSSSSAAVYIIAGGKRILYPSGEIFSAYRSDWAGIETYSQSDLDTNYPFTGDSVSEYLVDATKSKAYIIGQSACYELTSDTLTAFGVTYSSLSSAQQYSSSIFKNRPTNSCAIASKFIKLPTSNLVYWVDSGKKYPLNSYAAMLSKSGGQAPTIMEVSNGLIQSLSTGATIN